VKNIRQEVEKLRMLYLTLKPEEHLETARELARTEPPPVKRVPSVDQVKAAFDAEFQFWAEHGYSTDGMLAETDD